VQGVTEELRGKKSVTVTLEATQPARAMPVGVQLVEFEGISVRRNPKRGGGKPWVEPSCVLLVEGDGTSVLVRAKAGNKRWKSAADAGAQGAGAAAAGAEEGAGADEAGAGAAGPEELPEGEIARPWGSKRQRT